MSIVLNLVDFRHLVLPTSLKSAKKAIDDRLYCVLSRIVSFMGNRIEGGNAIPSQIGHRIDGREVFRKTAMAVRFVVIPNRASVMRLSSDQDASPSVLENQPG